MAYGGTLKSQLPPKVPRPPSLNQNDFTADASSAAKAGQGPSSPLSSGKLPGEWHWPSLTTAEEDEDPATKFDLLIQLGRGSYGSVYKAQVRGTQEIVAVKVIPLGDKDEVLEIQKEIEMLKECNHPNVVRYLGSWRGSEALWIVMEHCGGGSVADLMHASDVPLDQDMISYICAETLTGLAYLHSIGKVHRDIKCGNILLTEAGEVKVADFGVAAQLSNTMSKRNTFIGTPHWMAPEVIQESRYDGKVDVWALGISAVEMAEVTPPRWSVHPMRVIFMISRDPPPRLADRDRWSLTFHDFVAQCLQKEPKVRPSAKYLLQHKFVVAPRPSLAAAALLPLIARSRDALQAMAAASDPPVAPPTSREAAAGHTGQFSWRAGPSGTVLAQHGSAPSTTGGPARGPWVNTGMVRARLAGISFGAPPDSQAQAGHDGGTMVAYGTRPMPGGTMVVNADASSSRLGTLGPSGTFVTAGGEAGVQGGSDYQAAVQAASHGADGYMAAVQAAAAQAAQESGGKKGGHDSLPPSMQKAPPPAARERERLLERLRGVCEGGSVIPVPFLRAAHAVPSAILDDLRAPYVLHPAHTPALLDSAAVVAPQPDDWAETLAALCLEGSLASSRDLQSSEIPTSVLAQVKRSPVILNLLRTLAYYKCRAESDVMLPEAADKMQNTIQDISDALRTILCL
ncbi:hypothetical protein ABBQ32_001339 [Trebouxia sp. C0010 RCD-2024]